MGLDYFCQQHSQQASQPMWDFFSLINQQSTEGQSRKMKYGK